jgi:protein TonB
MSFLAPAFGGPLAYRGPQSVDARQRLLAIGGVVALHAAVIGGFVIAQMHPPVQPPEPTLSVSFITEQATEAAPTPPQPQPPSPPPPEPRMMATPRPTASTMTAPPMEAEPPREAVIAPPAPPAPAAPSAPTAAAPGPVTPPSFTAAYLNNPVFYPPSSRRKREEGTVRLRVQVSAEGAPLQVLLDRSSGHPDLDAAALDVVRKRWKFAPAKQADRPVAAWVLVPLEYSLKR